MNYNQAYKIMRSGGKVRQGIHIYFLGKSSKQEPYTLIRKPFGPVKIAKGFISIKKKGEFLIVE